MKPNRLWAAVVLVGIASVDPAQAQQTASPEAALFESLEWRQIGPANMMGRITDVEGIAGPSKTFYVAAAAGGIWKTTNNGTTFRQLWPADARVISMGDLAIAPSDTLQIWAGTGEEDSRNSISPGGGIFKSTDGGRAWQAKGLEATQVIARIVVHPTNPNVVWVAALGAIWNHNPERGLYKTTDGGDTWRLVKFISDKAGFIDVAIHPRDPNVLFAASWERVRGPYFLESGGPGSALWKSTDGGETWTEVKGNGFPTAMKGRIGLSIARSNPDVMYAMVEAEREADNSGGNGLYRSQDGGVTWEKMNSNNVRPFYYSQVRADPNDPNRVYWSSTPVNWSPDGGRSIGNTTVGIHVDHHAMWIDPSDSERVIVGNDGGVAITYDRGGNWDFLNHFAVGQFYNISHDFAVPYNVCGGLQDNGSWCGPSRRAGGITNADWYNVGGGDGFVTQQDPRDPHLIYSESQGGSMGWRNTATGENGRMSRPSWQSRYRVWEDSIAVARGDESRPETAQMRARIAAFRAKQLEDSVGYQLRYNWNTPYFLSPHDADVYYAGANRVLKAVNRGEMMPISPDLTRGDTVKIRISTQTTGGITRDATGAETYATIVSLNESPLRRGMLFAGTDDGKVWMSPDDGGTWQDLTGRFAGVPDETYVSRIEPSHHVANRFYVTFDNHRRGDFTPYVFVTDDGGRTFRSIASNLPTGSADFVHVIREDPYNPALLFAGTDVGAYVSTDRGASWSRFMNGLPTVPVHDLKIHPRDRELIAGTHGRSIWVVDILPLQQRPQQIVAGGVYLYEPRPAFHYVQAPFGGGNSGHRTLEFEGGPSGNNAEIAYYVASASGSGQARIALLSARGDTVWATSGPVTPGYHTVNWNFRVQASESEGDEPLSPSERRDSIRLATRLTQIADSLVQAGRSREVVDQALAFVRGEGGGGAEFGGRGGGRGGGGGGRGGRGGNPDRPGETAAVAQQARGGGGGGGGGRGGRGGGGGGGFGNVEGEVGDVLREIAQRLQSEGLSLGGGRGGRGGRGGGGGGGGGGAALADPGQYTVVLTVDGRTQTQTLRLERVGSAGG